MCVLNLQIPMVWEVLLNIRKWNGQQKYIWSSLTHRVKIPNSMTWLTTASPWLPASLPSLYPLLQKSLQITLTIHCGDACYRCWKLLIDFQTRPSLNPPSPLPTPVPSCPGQIQSRTWNTSLLLFIPSLSISCGCEHLGTGVVIYWSLDLRVARISK